MSWGLEGAIQAYENSRKWNKYHNLEANIGGNASFLGYKGIMPRIREFGNVVLTPFKAAAGIAGIGTEEAVIPKLNMPESFKGTELETNIREFEDLTYQAIDANADSMRHLKNFEFNKSAEIGTVSNHLESRADEVSLPGMMSNKGKTAAAGGALSAMAFQSLTTDGGFINTMVEDATGIDLPSSSPGVMQKLGGKLFG